MKGYLRKAGALLAVKEIRNAQEAYRKALELDPNCQVGEFSFYYALRYSPAQFHNTSTQS